MEWQIWHNSSFSKEYPLCQCIRHTENRRNIVRQHTRCLWSPSFENSVHMWPTHRIWQALPLNLIFLSWNERNWTNLSLKYILLQFFPEIYISVSERTVHCIGEIEGLSLPIPRNQHPELETCIFKKCNWSKLYDLKFSNFLINPEKSYTTLSKYCRGDKFWYHGQFLLLML